MLETVREYAAERLTRRRRDEGAVRHRQALWCLDLAQAAEHELEGPQQANWFARLDQERENLRVRDDLGGRQRRA